MAIHFLHIGKSGGTAVIEAISKSDPKADIRVHPHSSGLGDVPFGDTCFFVLRDPVERYVSGFYSRQRRGEPRYSGVWSDAETQAFARFPTANALAEALSSNDMVLQGQADEAFRSIEHVRSSYADWLVSADYFEERSSDILYIGCTDYLDAEFSVLRELICLSADAALPRDDVRAHRNPPNVDRALTPTALSNLQQRFRTDYDFMDLASAFRVRRGLPAFPAAGR